MGQHSQGRVLSPSNGAEDSARLWLVYSRPFLVKVGGMDPCPAVDAFSVLNGFGL